MSRRHLQSVPLDGPHRAPKGSIVVRALTRHVAITVVVAAVTYVLIALAVRR